MFAITVVNLDNDTGSGTIVTDTPVAGRDGKPQRVSSIGEALKLIATHHGYKFRDVTHEEGE